MDFDIGRGPSFLFLGFFDGCIAFIRRQCELIISKMYIIMLL